MKIAIDGQLFFEEQKTGIGWLAHNVVCHLNSDENDEFQMNCFTMGGNRKRQYLVEQYQKYGVMLKKVGWFHGGIYSRIWNKCPIPYWIFFGRNSDITIFFNYIIPPGVKGKKIAFVHDMAYRAYPDTLKKETKAALSTSMERTCKIADCIITISEFSKQEIIKYLNVPENKIHVISLGVDTKYYHSNYTEQMIQAVKDKYGIHEKYLFYQGTLEPRKNLKKLIEAYAISIKNIPYAPDLILAGKKGWMYDEIFETVKLFKLEEKVKFLGYIELEEIPKLMSGAIAFVYPSLYEGFGLPPLEAMACGAPVIASNVSSIPEVVGNAGILVNPQSKEEIAEAMIKIVKDEQLRNELHEKGIIRARKFQWSKATEQVIEIIEEVKKQQ